jgi:predicted RNA binding protein YcfA (HicA-like mRNA interferase family)
LTKLPRVTPAQLIRALEKNGFLLTRQSGSHIIFKDAQGKRVTVPSHSGKTLHPRLIKAILVDADLSPEDLRE